MIRRPFLCGILSALVSVSSAQQNSPPAQPQDPVLPAATPRARTVAELAAETVVVFNENDIDSTALAGLYLEKRGIPTTNLISIRCSRSEEIPRSEYDETIANPLRRELVDRGLWKLQREGSPGGRVAETKIRFVVLMYGIPLRVSETGGYDGDKSQGDPPEVFRFNGCAVDSELALLGLYSRQISGALENPYYRESRTIEEADFKSQLLVTRLDGPSPAVVRRMIEDTIATEAKGLRGFTYVDAQGLPPGPLQVGDRWFHQVAKDARMNGLPVILDNGPALFPDIYPMRNAALYFGWYAEHAAGPLAQSNFRFVPGAVAMHLHSFSAITLRSTSRGWCGPLLNAGAAATFGNVAEPYLGLTPQPDIFSQRLREGFTFAEAAYMSQRALSWMTTMIGDPLYRPFINRKDDPNDPWDAYRLGVKTWLEKNRATGEAALRDSAKKLNSGIVSESMGLLELFGNDHRAAIEAFQQARSLYSSADDRVRVAMHEFGSILATKSKDDAVRFLKDQAAANTSADSSLLLKALAQMYSENKPAGTTPAAGPKTPKKPEPKKQ